MTPAPTGNYQTRRLKHVARVIMGQSPASEDCVPFNGDAPFLQGNAEFGKRTPSPRYSCYVARKTAASGDILFSVRAPVGAINLADFPYGIGRGLCAIRPSHLLDRDFTWYALHAARVQLHLEATGSTYDAVSVSHVGNMSVPVPTLQEQRAVVRFLDREIGRIDSLGIGAMGNGEGLFGRLSGLLSEYRNALISAAVTGQIDVGSAA